MTVSKAAVIRVYILHCAIDISLKAESSCVAHTCGTSSRLWLRDGYRFGCRNWTQVFIDIAGVNATVLLWDSVSSNEHSLEDGLSDC